MQMHEFEGVFDLLVFVHEIARMIHIQVHYQMLPSIAMADCMRVHKSRRCVAAFPKHNVLELFFSPEQQEQYDMQVHECIRPK